MPIKRLTTNEFIEKSNEIHNLKYDYSLVKYINAKTKVEIICPFHGNFLQTPDNHFVSGCKKCGIDKISRERSKTIEDFIENSIKKHGNVYNYDKVNYINAKTKVEIICKKHGSFLQIPDSHLKSGCKKCGDEKRSKLSIKSTEWFVDRSIKLNGNEYDYSMSVYINAKTKVEIICKKHGSFLQLPSSHIGGRGCPNCKCDKISKKLRDTKCDFLKNAIKKHGNIYNYEKVKYINRHKKIEIVCKKHGSFMQSPNNHIRENGCPLCCNSISRGEVEWLNLNNVKERQVKIKICGKCYIVDGIYKSTIYEFYGDYWHGNPNKYSPRKINKSVKKTFGELHKNTMERERLLIENGYTIVSIWESEFKEFLNKNNNYVNL